MTREEAIKILKGDIAWIGFTEKWNEALNMAIKALEQEPCDDAISKQKLLKAIATLDKFGCNADKKLVPYRDHFLPYIRYYDVINCIEIAFPVTPQPKMGSSPEEQNKWIPVSERLPEINKYVLAFSNSRSYIVAWYNNGQWNSGLDENIEVEAWLDAIPKYEK